MADKSAYMGAPGSAAGYGSGGYVSEQYAWGNASSGGSFGSTGSNNAGGSQQPASSTPGVTKPRTDVSCYLGP